MPTNCGCASREIDDMPDDPVDTATYSWGSIGRLNNTLGPFCTGTLTGPRKVLTAAHCPALPWLSA